MATRGSRPLYPVDRLQLILYDEDRAQVAIIGDYDSLKCTVTLFDQGTLDLTLPITSAACSAEYSGATALSTDFLNWSFDVIYNGQAMFSGPVARCLVEHDGSFASAKVRLNCVSWIRWLLGARLIESNSGAGWGMTSTAWDDICRQLVRDQCETGSVQAPPEYPGGFSRDDFGPFTVTVEGDTSTATTGDFAIQCGKPLLNTVMEMSVQAPDDASMLWPYMVETSAGTFEFRVLVGRSGGSREIGSDKSASIALSGFTGNVGRFRRATDHQLSLTVARAAGAGRGANQRRRYVPDTGGQGTIGTREDGVTLRKAVTNAELDNEARLAVHEQKLDNVKQYDFEVAEQVGSQFLVDFELKDTISVTDVVTSDTVTRLLIGAEVLHNAGRIPELRLKFGKLPRSMHNETARSGGGAKGGGRKGGGPPKDSEGDSEVDPDTIQSYAHIQTQSGDTDAEGANHYAKFTGKYSDQVVRAQTDGTNSSDSDQSGTPDLVRHDVVATFYSPAPDANGYVWIYTSNSGWVQLLATQPVSGGPDPTEITS